VIADASVCAINQAEVISHFVYLGALLDDVRAMLGALPMLSSQRTTRLPGKPQLTRSNRIGRIVVRRSVLPCTGEAAWRARLCGRQGLERYRERCRCQGRGDLPTDMDAACIAASPQSFTWQADDDA
jgi:hypothetical protein